MTPLAEVFVQLFRGRGDAFGTWAGGAVRERVTPDMFERHLLSTNPEDWFGVYNVIGERCSWGCVDIDTDDVVLAYNIQACASSTRRFRRGSRRPHAATTCGCSPTHR